jgi:hypothetical protein
LCAPPQAAAGWKKAAAVKEGRCGGGRMHAGASSWSKVMPLADVEHGRTTVKTPNMQLIKALLLSSILIVIYFTRARDTDIGTQRMTNLCPSYLKQSRAIKSSNGGVLSSSHAAN